MGGLDVEPSPHGPPNFEKAVAEVATVELVCFPCHLKDNNYAYTIAAGCMQQFCILFKLLEFVWIESIYT